MPEVKWDLLEFDADLKGKRMMTCFIKENRRKLGVENSRVGPKKIVPLVKVGESNKNK